MDFQIKIVNNEKFWKKIIDPKYEFGLQLIEFFHFSIWIEID